LVEVDWQTISALDLRRSVMSEVNADSVVEALGQMNVMQVIALTKELEQKWGVEAKPQLGQVITTLQPEVPESNQTEFSVVFVSFPADKKMALVKMVREVLNLGLLDSKNLVESLPKTIKEGVSKEEAEAMKTRLVEAGGVVEIK
jgi:large subunit ribosomal protein L7/L12